MPPGIPEMGGVFVRKLTVMPYADVELSVPGALGLGEEGGRYKRREKRDERREKRDEHAVPFCA